RIPLAESFTVFAVAIAEMFGVIRVETAMIASIFAPSVEAVIVAVLLLAPLHTIIFDALPNLAIPFFISANESFTIFARAIAAIFVAVRVKTAICPRVLAPFVQPVVIAVVLLPLLEAAIFPAIASSPVLRESNRTDARRN